MSSQIRTMLDKIDEISTALNGVSADIQGIQAGMDRAHSHLHETRQSVSDIRTRVKGQSKRIAGNVLLQTAFDQSAPHIPSSRRDAVEWSGQGFDSASASSQVESISSPAASHYAQD